MGAARGPGGTDAEGARGGGRRSAGTGVGAGSGRWVVGQMVQRQLCWVVVAAMLTIGAKPCRWHVAERASRPSIIRIFKRLRPTEPGGAVSH